jgi:[acyl-carrier-protein] S-malonyltransferase
LTAAQLAAPKVPIVANFTADVTDGADQILRALDCQVCGTVRWTESIQRLIALGFTDFVECGPGGGDRRVAQADRPRRDLFIIGISRRHR